MDGYTEHTVRIHRAYTHALCTRPDTHIQHATPHTCRPLKSLCLS